MSEGGVHRLASGRTFTRYRSKRVCVLVAGTRRDAARMRNVSAAGATLETLSRPPLGDIVSLQHPEAGEISARVSRHTRDGIGLSFEVDEAAVSFAVLALAIDMTDRPAR